jgi:hypothetical protein
MTKNKPVTFDEVRIVRRWDGDKRPGSARKRIAYVFAHGATLGTIFRRDLFEPATVSPDGPVAPYAHARHADFRAAIVYLVERHNAVEALLARAYALGFSEDDIRHAATINGFMAFPSLIASLGHQMDAAERERGRHANH